ncbi:MAG: MraY family glycosyltransferase, partial [Candidatus Margulisiibacteriota bacterium]
MLAFILALMISLSLTYLVRKYSASWGLLDLPAERKMHKAPIPRSGGLAMVLAVLISCAVFAGHNILVWQILTGTILICCLGFWDDKFSLSPKLKFIGQITIACLTVFYFHIRIELFPSSLMNDFLSIFWLVGITNALNLLDNMDGLSAGISIIAVFYFMFFALLAGQSELVILSLALIGAIFGFLRYNRNPASIFMGDSGSMSLGYMLAVLGIVIKVQTAWSGWQTALVPVLILGLPIFDTTLVTFLRRLN